MDPSDIQRGVNNAADSEQTHTSLQPTNTTPTVIPPSSTLVSDSERDSIEVEMQAVDNVMEGFQSRTSNLAVGTQAQETEIQQSVQEDESSTPNFGATASTNNAVSFGQTQDAVMDDSMEDDYSDMPALEPVSSPSVSPPPSYHPSPSATPSDEGASTNTSGTSTPQRNNRRPRVEDDHDEERDRRHPSQRAGNAFTSESNGIESANEPVLFLYVFPSIGVPPNVPLYVSPILAPRTERHQFSSPLNSLPFPLVSTSNTFPVAYNNSAGNNANNNHNAQASGTQNTPRLGDWQGLPNHTSNGVAITIDLLRGGPPVVRPVDENFHFGHPHVHAHGHHHIHTHAPPPVASPTEGTSPTQSDGGNENTNTSSAPQTNSGPGAGAGAQANNRDPQNLSAEELLRQIRVMTDILTSALGGLEGGATEDTERGKMVVRGLEEVPEGLARRMDALAKAQGGEDGMGGCAICWDGLLEDAGFGGELGEKAEHEQSRVGQQQQSQQQGEGDATNPASTIPVRADADNGEPQQTSGSSEPSSTKSDDQPLPKIVALPCSHAFHASCLVPWFSKPFRTTCPTCRFDIDPEGLIWNLFPTRPRAAGGGGGGGGPFAGLGGAFAGLPAGFTFVSAPAGPRPTGQGATTDANATGDNAQPAEQPDQPFGPGHGMSINIGGMQVPLVFVDGEGPDRPNQPFVAGGIPNRRAQSVPRRRTRSLPRQGTQAATTDNINLGGTNVGGATWTRSGGRPDLPQLPPGASRTVYHAHLPIGGVDVVFDVIPMGVGRFPRNGAPGPNQTAQQPVNNAEATNDPTTNGPTMPPSDTQTTGPQPSENVNSPNSAQQGNDNADTYLTFGMDMLFGGPLTEGPGDQPMDLDSSDEDAALLEHLRGVQPQQQQGRDPALPQAGTTGPNGGHGDASSSQPNTQPQPQQQRNYAHGTGVGLGRHLLQSLFGSLLPVNHSPAQSGRNSSPSGGNSNQPSEIATPPGNANAPPASIPPMNNTATSANASPNEAPRNNHRPFFENMIAQAIGVIGQALTRMPEVARPTPGNNTETASSVQPTASPQPQTQGQSQQSQNAENIPSQSQQPLPRLQLRAFEEAAATGLPTGIPAQLAQTFGPAPPPVPSNITHTPLPSSAAPATGPSSSTGASPDANINAGPLRSINEILQQYEPLFGQGFPLPPADDIFRDYEPLLPQFAARRHQGPTAAPQPNTTTAGLQPNTSGVAPQTNNAPMAAAPPRPGSLLPDFLARIPLPPLPLHIPPPDPIAPAGAMGATGAPGNNNRPRPIFGGLDLFDLDSPFFSGLRSRTGRHGPPPEPKKWSPPPPPGFTLRQRVEKKEKEAGLRCDDVSCGLGPSDEDPVISDTVAAMKQLSIHYPVNHQPAEEAGTKVCQHTFHPSCLVSAERVALSGANEQVDGNEVEVTCPVCRHTGCIGKEDWENGTQATF